MVETEELETNTHTHAKQGFAALVLQNILFCSFEGKALSFPRFGPKAREEELRENCMSRYDMIYRKYVSSSILEESVCESHVNQYFVYRVDSCKRQSSTHDPSLHDFTLHDLHLHAYGMQGNGGYSFMCCQRSCAASKFGKKIKKKISFQTGVAEKCHPMSFPLPTFFHFPQYGISQLSTSKYRAECNNPSCTNIIPSQITWFSHSL